MNTPRCIIYCRVSTDAQERDGTSLDTQERACAHYAVQQGWTVVAAVRDTASGFSLERPALAGLRQQAQAGLVDVVLAYALDRVSRKQTHVAILVEELEQAGVTLAFVTEKFEDTATGQLLRSVKAFAAEFEREKIAERTMRGKAERARSGKLPQGTGRGCYGYIYNAATGRRDVEPEQAAAVRRIFAQFCAGGSCHGIAVELNRTGVPALGGGGWHPLTIRRLLKNEVYTGKTVYRRTKVEFVREARAGRKRRRVSDRDESQWIEVPDATPAIIDRSTFVRVQDILSDPDRQLRGRPSQLYRLRGHVRCLVCSTPMVGQALMRGQYSYYRCRRSYGQQTDGTCRSRYIRAELLERVVREQIAKVLCEPALVLAEAERLAVENPGAQRVTEIQRCLGQVEEQQRRLARLYLAGTMPESVLKVEGARLSAELGRLERERQELEISQPALDLNSIRRTLPQVLTCLRRHILDADGDNLALMLEALQVEIAATAERVEISGVISTQPPAEPGKGELDLVTIARTSASPRARSYRRRWGG